MLTSLQDIKAKDIAPRALDFLRELGGATAIHLSGQDQDRTRVLVTLTHGNEPSGFEALHRWLRAEKRPLTNIVVILGGVEAALINPPFFHRQPLGLRDLNRCFNPPYNDSQGELAREILHYIQRQRPEAVVDMHNTSGAMPPFAVSCGHSMEKQALAEIFVDTLIVSELQMGTLMEQDFTGPVVTVEVGGSKQSLSLATAARGMERFFLQENLFHTSQKIAIFHHPLRLELNPQCHIDYADAPLPDCDVTIRSDIESLNFTSVGTEEFLGWIDTSRLPPPLHVRTAHKNRNTEEIGRYFSIKQGQLYPGKPMTLFMATTRADIAAHDCLFYFIHDKDR